MGNIRNSIKAIIIKDGKLLAIKAKDSFSDGFIYFLPGGGQEHGETMHDTLRRECLEEFNCRVKIRDMILVREYIGKNHEFDESHKDFHQVEYMFECDLEEGEDPGFGVNPDTHQIGIEWLDLSNITEYELYPRSLREVFSQDNHDKVYYGDLN